VGGRFENLTKAPYLVLFVILISISVGTASALITITLAGNVIVTGDLDMTGGDLSIENPGNEARILLGTNDPDNNDVIVFDDGSKVFFWREANDRFEINEDLAIQGDLNLAVPFGNDDDRILFDDENRILMWDDSDTQFDFNSAIVTNTVIQAGNAGPDVAYSRIGFGTADSGKVSTSADFFVSGNIETDDELYADGNIFVGTDNGADDDFIFFDDGSEFLLWDESATQFRFTDAIVTPGVIQSGFNGPDVSYNRIGGATTSRGLSGANDLLITNDLEVNGDLFIDGKIVGIHTYVVRTQISGSPTSTMDLFADCNLGDIATGGGFNYFGSTLTQVQDEPARVTEIGHTTQMFSGQPDSRHIFVRGSVGDSLQAFVICLDVGS